MPNPRSALSALAVPTLTLRAGGAAEAAEVWERYAVPRRWSTWAPQIQRVETSATRIAAGASGKVIGPLGAHIRFVIDDVDEAARSWSWRVLVGPVTLYLVHAVSIEGPGSATTLRIRGPLPIVAGYAPVAQLALNRLVRL
jgi:hypothetical protein